ncbi:MAG: EpsI family protein [Roseateles sp.]|uniref:exosortase C-terminal domain/associated protein EpsI n=1 Tax=Roseateles sp. TaxID=1971397 RepID=UPI0039ED6D7F
MNRAAPDWRLALALAALLLAAAWGVRAVGWPVRPAAAPAAPGVALADAVPRRFGGWAEVADGAVQVDAAMAANESAYSEQLLRSYQDRDGRTVMLTLAHIAQMHPYATPHAPDTCYAGAGFEIQSLTPAPRPPLMVRRMLAQRGLRREAVVFWMRLGDVYDPPSSAATRWHLLRNRLRGGPEDGILVRASQLLDVGDDPAAAHARLEGFLGELLAASPEAVRRKLRGP